MNQSISRRCALRTLTTGAAAVAAATALPGVVAAQDPAAPARLKGRIHQSVCTWCYNSLLKPEKGQPAKMTLEDFFRECARMGLPAIDLLGPEEWPIVKKVGLVCGMCNGPDRIPYGWNRLEHHEDLLPKFEKLIPEVASYGFPNIITFSGNRGGMSDQQGLENCVKNIK
jgi:hydroxypyruvate isomerase